MTHGALLCTNDTRGVVLCMALYTCAVLCVALYTCSVLLNVCLAHARGAVLRSLLPRPLSTQRVPVCCIPGCIVTCITLELRWCPGAGGVERRANSMRCENLMQPSWNGGVGAEDLCRQLGSVGRTVMLFITGTTLALGVRGLSCARRRCCLFLLRRGTFPW